MSLKSIIEKMDSIKFGKNKEISLKDFAMLGAAGAMGLTTLATGGWLVFGTSLSGRHVDERALKYFENCAYADTNNAQECYINGIKECVQNHPLPNFVYILRAVDEKSHAAASKLKNYVIRDKNES